MTTIVVIDSDEPGQTLVEQTEDSGLIARSWAPDHIPVEARLNPDAPPALDMRADSPTNGQELHWVDAVVGDVGADDRRHRGAALRHSATRWPPPATT